MLISTQTGPYCLPANVITAVLTHVTMVNLQCVSLMWCMRTNTLTPLAETLGLGNK